MNVLEWIYTWQFLGGAVVGSIFMRVALHAQCRRKDRLMPLPNGRHHRVPPLDWRWFGGAVALGSLGYVLLTATQARDDATAITVRQGQCQAAFATALRARSQLATDDSTLITKLADLNNEITSVNMERVRSVLAPPADIAALPSNDVRRLDWVNTVNRVFLDRVSAIRAEMDTVTEQRRKVLQARVDNPLPDPQC